MEVQWSRSIHKFTIQLISHYQNTNSFHLHTKSTAPSAPEPAILRCYFQHFLVNVSQNLKISLWFTVVTTKHIINIVKYNEVLCLLDEYFFNICNVPGVTDPSGTNQSKSSKNSPGHQWLAHNAISRGEELPSQTQTPFIYTHDYHSIPGEIY